jgi:hypothetical protein
MRRTRTLVLARETLGDLTPDDLRSFGGAAYGVSEIRRTLEQPFTCTFISQAIEPCVTSVTCTTG